MRKHIKHSTAVGLSLPYENEELKLSECEKTEDKLSKEEVVVEDPSKQPLTKELSEKELVEEKDSQEPREDEPVEKDPSEKPSREESVVEDPSEEQSEEPLGGSLSEPFSHYGDDNEHQTLNHSSTGEKKRSAEPFSQHELSTPKKHKLDHTSSSEHDSGPSGESMQDKLSKVIGCESTPEGQKNTGSSGKRKHGKWDTVTEGNGEALDGDVVPKRRKTSWSGDVGQLKMLGPLKLPDFVKGLVGGVNVDKLNEQLLEINQKLQAPEVVDDRLEKERSPSPLPIYDELGIRINTREFRLRAKLIKRRQEIVSELVRRNPAFRRHSDCKPSKLYKKLYIPVKQYPGYNFVGPILGPRGNTRKRMEMETGARIVIRGISSAKQWNTPQRDTTPNPSENEDLHVYVEADNQESLDDAVERVEKLLVPVDGLNKHKLEQLRELTELNGMLTRKTASQIDASYNICCDTGFPTSSYPLTGGLLSFRSPPVPGNASLGFCPSLGTSFPHAKKSYKEIDGAYLYVGCLPKSVDEERLVELFSPFGTISQAKVVKDKSTGLSKGYGFVRYTDPICASKAVVKMNGHHIDGSALDVRVPGHSPFSYCLTASTPGSKTEKERDDVNLYVGYLPLNVNDDRLIELFSPFGTICHSRVVKDKATGLSKGYGFVRYTDPISAAKAVEQLNGHRMGGKILRVKLASRLPIASSDRVSVTPIGTRLVPIYPGHAALTRQQHGTMDWLGPPGAGLSKPCIRLYDPLTVYRASHGSPYRSPVHPSLVSSNGSQPRELRQFPGSLGNICHRYYSPEYYTPRSLYITPPVSSSLVSNNDAQLTELSRFPGNLNKLLSSQYCSYPCDKSRSLYRAPIHSFVSSNVAYPMKITAQFPSNLCNTDSQYY